MVLYYMHWSSVYIWLVVVYEQYSRTHSKQAQQVV
jgi:hypothetical protein